MRSACASLVGLTTVLSQLGEMQRAMQLIDESGGRMQGCESKYVMMRDAVFSAERCPAVLLL
jgi:hypothetical protein